MDLLGKSVEDKITVFTGVVTGIWYYISECNQARVVPKVAKDAQSFDVQRLHVSPLPRVILDNGATFGCDKSAPKR